MNSRVRISSQLSSCALLLRSRESVVICCCWARDQLASSFGISLFDRCLTFLSLALHMIFVRVCVFSQLSLAQGLRSYQISCLVALMI